MIKEGVAVPKLFLPKGVAGKMKKINVKEFDENLFFFFFGMQRCSKSSVGFYLESVY